MDPSNWNDFSGVDIVIGIRSFDGQTYDTKPPSKLINAWHAGTPFVGGHDSAFKQIGTPTEDYYVVTTQEEACDVIADLARNTSQYARIVQKGFDQAKQYSRHAIAQRWVDLLKGPIDIRYSQWTKRGVCASWHAAVNAKYAYARQELGRLWRHLKKSQAS
ncbi:hypothetical protein C5Y97_08250 [Blastopirellula marina]|uniref:Glycosyltransferase family 1 protein n=2 Tax=Blastopirellula marina TaxID=124 RepID=A0A2S8G0V6_9BACT|nr:hypothetical protein C5Y98_08250 [Blastopirellula marina]PTL44722.1 hypothetical protein C5Y97_08250 [Blastopirellula marina]